MPTTYDHERYITVDGETGWRCNICGEPRDTPEPCVYCRGSHKPTKEKCGTCYSYERGNSYCRRICSDVEPSWTGCVLHCPSS